MNTHQQDLEVRLPICPSANTAKVLEGYANILRTIADHLTRFYGNFVTERKRWIAEMRKLADNLSSELPQEARRQVRDSLLQRYWGDVPF
jgi:hypothetical protein